MVRNFGPDVRYVRTPEGAAFYGLPVGSPIRASDIAATNRRAQNVGIKPPTLADTTGDHNWAVQSGNAGKAAKPLKPAANLYTVHRPTLTGPNEFKIGSQTYQAPEGSKLYRPKVYRTLRYVQTEDGKVYLFNQQGQIDLPDGMGEQIASALSEGERYVEEQFDSVRTDAAPEEEQVPGARAISTEYELEGLPKGTIVIDGDGDLYIKGEPGARPWNVRDGSAVSSLALTRYGNIREIPSQREVLPKGADPIDALNEGDVAISVGDGRVRAIKRMPDQDGQPAFRFLSTNNDAIPLTADMASSLFTGLPPEMDERETGYYDPEYSIIRAESSSGEATPETPAPEAQATDAASMEVGTRLVATDDGESGSLTKTDNGWRMDGVPFPMSDAQVQEWIDNGSLQREETDAAPTPEAPTPEPEAGTEDEPAEQTTVLQQDLADIPVGGAVEIDTADGQKLIFEKTNDGWSVNGQPITTGGLLRAIERGKRAGLSSRVREKNNEDAGTGASSEEAPTPEAPTPEPEAPSGTGDVATEQWIRSAPAGAQFSHITQDREGIDRATTWTKQDDGSWFSEKSGRTLQEDEVVAALDESTIIARPGPAEEDSTSLYPGAPDFTPEELQAAFEALNDHTGFQILYGMPRDSRLRDKEIVGALTTHARDQYPDLSPKQAVLAHLRDVLGLNDDEDQGTDAPAPEGETPEPQIVIGAAEPKRTGVQGMNGGSFSRSDIEQAIEILEAFQGKAFKSELNKKGNALGVLDPASIVGIHKDKTEGKRLFVEYLRNALGTQGGDDPNPGDSSENDDPPAPPAPEPQPDPEQDGDVIASPFWLDDAPTGTIIRASGGNEDKEFYKDTSGRWVDVESGRSSNGGDLWEAYEGLTFTVTRLDQTKSTEFYANLPTGSRVEFQNFPGNATVWTKGEDGLWTNPSQPAIVREDDQMADAEFVNGRVIYNPETDAPPPRSPQEMLGESPETLEEFRSLPDRTVIRALGQYFIKQGIDGWVRLRDYDDLPAWPMPTDSFAGVLRGITVVSLHEKDFGTDLPPIDEEDAFSTALPGDMLIVVSEGVTSSFRRLPSGPSGQFDQRWLVLNGSNRTFSDGGVRDLANLRSDSVYKLRHINDAIARPAPAPRPTPEGYDLFAASAEGEVVVVTFANGREDRWTRQPNEDGMRVWRNQNGTGQYEDNLPEYILALEQDSGYGRATYSRGEPGDTGPTEPQPGDNVTHPASEFQRMDLARRVKKGQTIIFERSNGSSFSMTYNGDSFDDVPQYLVDGRLKHMDEAYTDVTIWMGPNRDGITWRIEGDVVPEPPADEPDVDPADLPKPGETIQGADVLRTLPIGTRLIYTRKDGRTTAYNVHDGTLVTDRGTEVDFERANRMKFLVYSIGEGGATAPAPTPAPTPEPDPNAFTVEGRGVGQSVGNQQVLEASPVGTQVINDEGMIYTRVSNDQWADADGNTMYQSYRTAGFNKRPSGLKFYHIPTNNPIDYFDVVWGRRDEDYDGPAPADGMILSRDNLSHTLSAITNDSALILRLPNGDTQPWQKIREGEKVWFVRGDLSAKVNAGHFHGLIAYQDAEVEIVKLGENAGTPTAGGREVGWQDILELPDSTVFAVEYAPGKIMHVRQRPDQWDGQNLKGFYQTNSSALPEITDVKMRMLALEGRVTTVDPLDAMRFNDSAPLWLGQYDEATRKDALDRLPVGGWVRGINNGLFRKEDDGSWTTWIHSPSGNLRPESPITDDVLKYALTNNAAHFYIINDGNRMEPARPGEWMDISDVLRLPTGSRFKSHTSSGDYIIDPNGDVRRIDMDNGKPVEINRWVAENIQQSQGAFYRVDDLGNPFTADSLRGVQEGSAMTMDDLMRLPIGASFTSKKTLSYGGAGDGPYTYTVVSPFHVRQEGYGRTISVTRFDAARDDLKFKSYEKPAEVRLGGRIFFSEQLDEVTNGAILKSDTAVIQKLADDHYVILSKHSRSTTDANGVMQYSGSNGLHWVADSLPSGKKLNMSNLSVRALREAQTGSLFYRPGGKHWTKDASGAWLTPQGETSTDEGLIDAPDVEGDGYLIQPKDGMATVGKTVSQHEVRAARTGTLVKVTVPPEYGGAKVSNEYLYDAKENTWVPQIRNRNKALYNLTPEHMALLAFEGRVKLLTVPEILARTSHEDFARAVHDTMDHNKITALAQAQHPNVNFKPWSPGTGTRFETEQRIEVYKDFMIEAVRLLDVYPMLQDIKHIRGVRDGRSSAFAWVHLGMNIYQTDMEFNIVLGMNELDSRTVSGLNSGHFQGPAKPGLNGAVTATTHEFGHVFDGLMGRELGPVAKAKLRELTAGMSREQKAAYIKENFSGYSQTNERELVAESFENWHNNVTVTEGVNAVMAAMEEYIRIKKYPDFRFVKNVPIEGAPPSTDDGKISRPQNSRGSVTARVGKMATAREMVEMPVGTRVRRSDGTIWEKIADGRWRMEPKPGSADVTFTANYTSELYVRTATFEILEIGQFKPAVREETLREQRLRQIIQNAQANS